MPEEKWQEVVSDLGKVVRWKEVPRDEAQGEKTVYVGPVVQGLYVQCNTEIGENDSTMYEIKTLEHGLLSVWGTTVLDDKMKNVAIGMEVRIEFLGEQKPKKGGKSYGQFSIKCRPAPMQEVGSETNPADGGAVSDIPTNE